jgi:hypothetical protein
VRNATFLDRNKRRIAMVQSIESPDTKPAQEVESSGISKLFHEVYDPARLLIVEHPKTTAVIAGLTAAGGIALLARGVGSAAVAEEATMAEKAATGAVEAGASLGAHATEVAGLAGASNVSRYLGIGALAGLALGATGCAGYIQARARFAPEPVYVEPAQPVPYYDNRPYGQPYPYEYPRVEPPHRRICNPWHPCF